MKNDNLYSGTEARKGLFAGIHKVASAIGITMGTSGSNSIIEDIRNPGHYITNDGFSIANAIRLINPMEEMGRRILLESINRANRSSGDGSSTTAVLTSSILSEGIKHIGEVAPMEIKKSLEDCLPRIEASLKSQRKELVDKDGTIDFKLLKQVAAISAEDESIGEMISDIYKVIGKDGIINWEASKTPQDSFTIGTGIKIDGATYVSRYMCDLVSGDYSTQATIENPLVLLAKSKITSQGEMEKLIGELQNEGVKDLVIFCDEMEAAILNSFILARAPQTLGIRFLVIKMPTVFNDLWWEDLEKASGGRIIGPASGIKMRDAKMEFLGRFGKITVNRDDTFIDGIKDLTTHLLALKVDPTDENLARVARLNTKTARYYVGGHSESGLAYRRLKVEDAINSAWSAMQNGILAGGGVALFNIGRKMENQSFSSKSNIGELILSRALKTPIEQICLNAGVFLYGKDEDSPLIISGNIGFDTKNKELVNMFDAGIVDSFDVVWGAIKNAVGVAAGILTCGTVVLLPRKDDDIGQMIAEKVAEMVQTQ